MSLYPLYWILSCLLVLFTRSLLITVNPKMRNLKFEFSSNKIDAKEEIQQEEKVAKMVLGGDRGKSPSSLVLPIFCSNELAVIAEGSGTTTALFFPSSWDV